MSGENLKPRNQGTHKENGEIMKKRLVEEISKVIKDKLNFGEEELKSTVREVIDSTGVINPTVVFEKICELYPNYVKK